MNTKITALTLAAATAFAFTPKPAVAGDKELAVVGGLLGGLIIASAISDHNDDHRTVVVAGGYRHDRHDRNDGYWKTVEVRVWVPGGWVYERSPYGGYRRIYVAGHHECRTDRVWVAYDRHGRHHRNDHRDIGRGYGRDRDDRHDRDHRR
jgi:hypothetical protein